MALARGTEMAKRAALRDFAAQKNAPAAPEPDRPSPSVAERRGQTLRLSVEAWRQLKIMAAEEGRPAHDLLLDAVNDLFRKHGKPPIA